MEKPPNGSFYILRLKKPLSFLVYRSRIRYLVIFPSLFPPTFITVTTWCPQALPPALSLPIFLPVMKWSLSCEANAACEGKASLLSTFLLMNVGMGAGQEINGLLKFTGYTWRPASSSRMNPWKKEGCM